MWYIPINGFQKDKYKFKIENYMMEDEELKFLKYKQYDNQDNHRSS